MESLKCSRLVTPLLIACTCILSPLLEVDAHILVYRRITNQLIEEYNDMPAQFGPSLTSSGIKVFAVPAVPSDACDKIAPPPTHNLGYPSNAKYAAIIQRWAGVDCTFELKVRNAQAARFDAVVIYNNNSDDLEHMSAQNSSGIMIPSVFVGHTTGMNLRSFFTPEIVLVINDELPFNINTQLILPFSILIGLCFLTMIFYMIYRCIREERNLRRYRLPKRMLKKLPIIKFTKNSNIAYDTCVICIETFAEGDKLRVLPCKHPYHSNCIDVWLTENKRECPICKRKVFTKGEARSQRNRQSSLDSIVDTDDDTAPLLQQSSQSSLTTTMSSNNSTRHGTFQRGSTPGGGAADVTSDDENMLSSTPARRINPLTVHQTYHPTWRLNLTVMAQKYLVPTNIQMVSYGQCKCLYMDGSVAATPRSQSIATHSSNNVLNPNLSGSFKEEDDDEPPYSVYMNRLVQQPVVENETDSVFIQTPTQGGIAVAALPRDSNDEPVHTSHATRSNTARFW
ncbi:E3 ubiquitin-protein ligase Godzilla-like [Musca domestica]|uniref:E3 ubiquitin-protein ligase Godzilla-like n=1 Tax=Musca domestica TaxID=7370 RepID=A0ABM3VR71_MUSDO|nr:E3 ubiquitin-protein ligase Godzilla-like [Musca domestica]